MSQGVLVCKIMTHFRVVLQLLLVTLDFQVECTLAQFAAAAHWLFIFHSMSTKTKGLCVCALLSFQPPRLACEATHTYREENENVERWLKYVMLQACESRVNELDMLTWANIMLTVNPEGLNELPMTWKPIKIKPRLTLIARFLKLHQVWPPDRQLVAFCCL